MLQRANPFNGLPRRYFRAIAADPPQRFKSYTALQSANWHSRRDVEKHYPTMSIEEISALPVRDLAHPDGCHLFLWITGPNLTRAAEIITGWGFRYSAVAFVWVKLRRGFNQDQLFFTERDLHVGLGLTTRHNVEICLLARRGNPRRLAKNVREIVVAPTRQHSRKPDEIFTRIEQYCDGPYLELFARAERPGWTGWENEVSRFNVAAVS